MKVKTMQESGLRAAALCAWAACLLATCAGAGGLHRLVPVAGDAGNGTHDVVGSHRIYIEGDDFKIDGETLFIRSGSLHYFRVPPEYWRDRLRKLKVAGLNSVATYVEWSFHEPEERQYWFEGARDVARFVRVAAEEGLHVLLRPGPYICAERDLGGLPYWLLGKYPNIKLRTTNPDFIQETTRWFSILFGQLKPLLFGNGGPIILVQVENEYGSFGRDAVYMEKVRDLILQHVGPAALLYTTDGGDPSMLSNGRVSGALTTVDFGAYSDKEVASVLRRLRTALPRGPLVNSELYTGWLTQWGGVRGASDTAAVARTLRYLLRHNVSFNFYMFHGGTNFEFTSGALGQPFLPHVTSYDYDAPLDEAGDPTPKYTAIRDLLTQFDPSVALTPAPLASRKGAYGAVRLRASLQLLSLAGAAALGSAHAAVRGPRLPSFEALRQRAGLVLYQTSVDFTEGTLFIESPRDLVLVYVDGVKQGQISRQKYQPSLKLTGSGNSTLSLLVENQGRVNYGASQNLHDFKGILSAVQLNNRVLTGPWNVTGYRLENVDSGPVAFDDSCDVRNGPVLYEGSLVLPPGETPLDTFINPTGWHKGLIWINGHNLGRYYLVGPQVTLYVPGAWLKPAPAVNRVQLLELVAAPAPPAQLDIQFIDHPILDNCTRPTA